jgi:hypothetical protein
MVQGCLGNELNRRVISNKALEAVAAMSELSGMHGRDQLLEALAEIRAELDTGAEWENDTLPRFLEAFAALLGSIENAYLNTGRPVPTDPWELMVTAIRGASSYE